MGLLEGKVALITGSGRGIGAATARAFAAEGARVVISDLDQGPAEETVAAIRGAGGDCAMENGDLTDLAFPAHLVDVALDTYGGLDIIVNNAGYPWDGEIEKMSKEQWGAMLDIHLTAPFRLLHAASRHLLGTAKKERAALGYSQPRKIITVSSVAGVYGNAGQVNYSTAKAGVIGLTKTLAKEWGRYNIQVNCVCYGFIDTRLTATKGSAGEVEHNGNTIQLGIPQQMRQGGLLRVPLGRKGTPEEAAGPMLFLASSLSNYVSGAILEVTGGFVP
jgi:3-oxoacyl-[acyl-carrier protein] reductase